MNETLVPKRILAACSWDREAAELVWETLEAVRMLREEGRRHPSAGADLETPAAAGAPPSALLPEQPCPNDEKWQARVERVIRGHSIPHSEGYVKLYCPMHPRSQNSFVYEHVVVAERTLGRFLESGEQVHHINGVKGDNRPENLVVFGSVAEHRLHHRLTHCKRGHELVDANVYVRRNGKRMCAICKHLRDVALDHPEEWCKSCLVAFEDSSCPICGRLQTMREAPKGARVEDAGLSGGSE